jgi:carboxypeptidase C (cathepsin A)
VQLSTNVPCILDAEKRNSLYRTRGSSLLLIVPPLCYDFVNVAGFLAKPDVAAALGVTGITWQSCNRAVNIVLVFAGDWMLDLTPLVPKILSSGVRIVVSAGESRVSGVTDAR